MYGGTKSINNKKATHELLGFLESLTYSVPDSAPFENQEGARVPKYIEVAITYKVVHEKVPEKGDSFYGFAGSNL